MTKDVKIYLFEPFKSSISPELMNTIKSRFKEYKLTGVPHETYGRDTTYDFPSSIKMSGLKHIHIRDKTSKRWAMQKFTFDKKSNTALIYCSGYFNENAYLLLGLIENAHEYLQNNVLYLLELADVADRFRNKF